METAVISGVLGFLDTLPAGFAIGPREQMAVRELMLTLIDSGAMPADRGRLKTLLAPLVCGDPDQQREFYARFDEWARPAPPPPPPVELPKAPRWSFAIMAFLFVATVVAMGAEVRRAFWSIPELAMPRVSIPSPCLGCEEIGRPAVNILSGVVRTPDGLTPLRGATVRVPAGRAIREYPKLVTDAGGRFAMETRTGGVLGAASSQPALAIKFEEPIASVSFSPDGTRIASDTNDSVVVSDTRTGRRLVECKPNMGTVWGGAFSPDGSRIAISAARGAAVCDSNSGTILLRASQNIPFVSDVAFSPDGNPSRLRLAKRTPRCGMRAQAYRCSSCGVTRKVSTP
jgi:hypothetical protein